VLGVPCAAPFALNASLLAEAARRLRDDFLFVGLTEDFDASVCLFHARLGGTTLPVAAQFLNGRPRARPHHSFAPNRSANAGRLSPWPMAPTGATLDALLADPWDEALYTIARTRFERDLAEARSRSRSLPTPQSFST